MAAQPSRAPTSLEPLRLLVRAADSGQHLTLRIRHLSGSGPASAVLDSATVTTPTTLELPLGAGVLALTSSGGPSELHLIVQRTSRGQDRVLETRTRELRLARDTTTGQLRAASGGGDWQLLP
jgi:hypothetical protein